MQNKKKLVNKSQDNEFGDKSNLDTCQKWAQFGPQKNFLTTETSSTSKKSLLSIKICKMKKSLSIKVKIMNLETKNNLETSFQRPSKTQIFFLKNETT